MGEIPYLDNKFKEYAPKGQKECMTMKRKESERAKVCRIYHKMKRRCEDERHIKYKYYGGRGIRVAMTIDDLEAIWKRDKANKMKMPSIDRIDSKKDYSSENCRFLEYETHCGFKRGHKPTSGGFKKGFDPRRYIPTASTRKIE